MNGMYLMVATIIYFLLAYFIYGKFIARRFGVDNGRVCPSKKLQNNVDYVPTNPFVLFGHHFASIAGAGPIIGPILAAQLGWLPAFLWIALGCVFIGALHDFASMFLSVRNKGLSIAYVIEKEINYVARQLFLGFCLFILILVCAVFTLNVADGFIHSPATATSSILFIFMAPFFAIITKSKYLTMMEATIIFVPLLFIFVWVGTVFPLDLTQFTSPKNARLIWLIVLFYYAAVASLIPVWFLLQPRDYLNSFLLYAMLIIGFAGIFVAKPAIEAPAVIISPDNKIIPDLIPLLFITIACGACSGFHALVASGTASKQVSKENHMLPITYGGMLVEGVLALMALLSVIYLNKNDMISLLSGSTGVPASVAFAKGLSHFSVSLGLNENLVYNFICLAVSAFMLTSLDTAARLARFIWQELLLPQQKNTEEQAPAASSKVRNFLSNRWVAAIILTTAAFILALSGNANNLWPIFGASNQLMAALTLLAVTLWLLRKKRPALFAMLPMFFMMIISVWGISTAIFKARENCTIIFLGNILLLLALVLIILSIKALIKQRKKSTGELPK